MSGIDIHIEPNEYELQIVQQDQQVVQVTTQKPVIEISPVGLQGPAGVTGGTSAYREEFEQSTPELVWIVPHTFNGKPSVNIAVGGEQIEADVDYADNNTIHITHGEPKVGFVYLS